jgi:hypothetical protein
MGDSSYMETCSDWEELNTKERIAALRYRRFLDSVAGTVLTAKDHEELGRLEEEMDEATRALQKHADQHGCGG